MGSQIESLVKMVKEREGKGSVKAKVLSFVSGKGGVGKTGITTSLAYILANHFKKRVLLLDCDIGLGNVHLLLGLSPEKSLKSVLQGAPIEGVIQRAFNYDVVLGFSGLEALEELEALEAANLVMQIERVMSSYDYVILDNGAGINRYTVGFSRAAATTYVVTTPEPTALTDAYAFIKSLFKLYGYSSFKVVVNMVKDREEGFRTFERLKASTVKFLGVEPKLAGTVPYSERFKEALKRRKPLCALYPNEPYCVEIKRIAQLETGELLPEDGGGFVKRLLKFLFQGD